MVRRTLSRIVACAVALSAATPALAEASRSPTPPAPPAAAGGPSPEPSVGPTTPERAAPPPVTVSETPAVLPSAPGAQPGPGPQPAPGAATKPKAPSPIPEPVKLSDDPRPTLAPGTFVSIVNAADRYRAIVEAGGWPLVPAGATLLKAGGRGSAVAALRQRLAATEDLPADGPGGDALDEVVAAAIRRFQMRHGLEETGLVGPRTLHHLNVPAETRLRQLQGSAARLLGSKFPFGDRYVIVNIPSQTVEAVRGGSVVRRHVAVVGKPDRPSPTVETRVTSVNFNPTWTVPISLVKKDIIPHVRKDPTYLAKMKIRIIDRTGQEIDPARLDWATERAADYTLRQDAGLDNSLGEVRIDMPNRHAVFMHDTPSKRLFARTQRLLSSGCVRVAGVKELIAWLLEGTPGPDGVARWGAGEIDAAITSARRLDAKLAKPVPVAWVYLTGYATPDGTAHFRDDVYGLDPAAAAPADPAQPAPRALTIEDLVTSSTTPAAR